MKTQKDLEPHPKSAIGANVGSEILQRLEAYKKANTTDVAYYRRVIREAPERALDMLLYKDLLRHEADMQLIMKQLPLAQAFYEGQPPEVKRRIDQRLNEVDPYYREKAFFDAVSRERSRKSGKSGATDEGNLSPCE